MNSFMSWVGGKKALREEIVRRFPLSYERYIEVFGGGGWVLFHKPPGRDFEVYNDFNSLLANLYRCVRDRHEELIDSLRYVLNSREDFELIKQALARDTQTQTVTVNPLDTQTLTFLNEPLCSLTLTKLDFVTGKPIPGTEFTVKDGNGTVLGRYTTGKDGTVVVTGLVPGSTVEIGRASCRERV